MQDIVYKYIYIFVYDTWTCCICVIVNVGHNVFMVVIINNSNVIRERNFLQRQSHFIHVLAKCTQPTPTTSYLTVLLFSAAHIQCCAQINVHVLISVRKHTYHIQQRKSIDHNHGPRYR